MTDCELTGCTRENFFSNPKMLFEGVPTGEINQSNNAKAINETAAVVSHFHDNLQSDGCRR